MEILLLECNDDVCTYMWVRTWIGTQGTVCLWVDPSLSPYHCACLHRKKGVCVHLCIRFQLSLRKCGPGNHSDWRVDEEKIKMAV